MNKYYINGISYKYSKLLIDYFDKNSILFNYTSSLPFNGEKKINSKSNSLFKWSLSVGLLFFILSYLFQYWTEGFYQMQNLGSKPFFSIITSLPISLELGFLATILAGVLIFVFRSLKSKISFNSTGPDRIYFEFDLDNEQNQNLITFIEKYHIDCSIEEFTI